MKHIKTALAFLEYANSSHERPIQGPSKWHRAATYAACLVLFTVSCAQAAFAQRGPTAVGVATVTRTTISDTRSVIGELVAARQADVATRTAGIVTEVSFIVGDSVAKDATMVRLDQSRLDVARQALTAEVEVAEAGIAVAQANLKRARQTFQRQAALRRSRAFSRSRYEDTQRDTEQAQGELTRAQAQMRRAKALLAEIDYRLKHTKILAPFDGVVIRRHAQPGAYLAVGAPVATLLDISNLEIEANVPAELIAGLDTGREIPVTLDGGISATARMRAVVPVQANTTRTRPVRLSVNLGGVDQKMLARGKSVTVKIPASAPRSVLTIPKDALVQSGSGWIVYVAADGKAQPKRVSLGQSTGVGIEITSGLSENEKVVVRGNERLRPGQPIRPMPSGAKAKPNPDNPKQASPTRGAGAKKG